VNDLRIRLIEESVQDSGKLTAVMSREDKIEAIKFLNARIALLITKTGDKISKYFGISKYTVYNYLDSNTYFSKEQHTKTDLPFMQTGFYMSIYFPIVYTTY
jgi:predicted transcriptional regulator YheO